LVKRPTTAEEVKLKKIILMLKIKLNIEVDKIKVITFPNERNDFTQPLVKDVIIPGIFYMGKKLLLEHKCKLCSTEILTGVSEPNFKMITTLSNYYIKDISFLDLIGQLFNLDVTDEINVNNNHIYDYSLTQLVKGLARISYYYCLNCNAKYILTYMFLFGEGERNPSPDEVYIEKILHVDFDQELFFKTLKEAETGK